MSKIRFINKVLCSAPTSNSARALGKRNITSSNHATDAIATAFHEKLDASSEGDIRNNVAPWIKIGQYEKGLLSHLSLTDVLRALFVLKVCSLEKLVDKSPELFELALKLGPLAKWPLRKTFFDQFVGGDTMDRMTRVVASMHQRGLTLMVAPVLEEDPNDQKSSGKTYDNNIRNLLELSDMCATLEKSRKPILQLKMSAIVPAKTLEEVTNAIGENGYRADKLAKYAEMFANAMETSNAVDLPLSKVTEQDFVQGLRRANMLVKQAQEQNVLIVVDAEFFVCQRAIAAVALALMAKYNSNDIIVGNTIQAYLKESVRVTELELETTEKLLKVNWWGKVVRGAYMDRERKLAQERGLQSPICDSYQMTNRSYNKSVALILDHVAKTNMSSGLLVATHNENSIRLAAERMKSNQIPTTAGPVAFGQIYGMADYLSTPLVAENYTVYKSTPYGPMEKVMPYLSRRASENRAVIQGAREERNMLSREFKYRLGLA